MITFYFEFQRAYLIFNKKKLLRIILAPDKAEKKNGMLFLFNAALYCTDHLDYLLNGYEFVPQAMET